MEQNSLEELLQELKEQNDSLENQVEIYKQEIEQLKKIAEKEQNN
jgi:molecular chaperone GrpE (heat shock protein)